MTYDMSFREFFKAWLPVIVWMAIMFIGSTDLMSAEHTSRFLMPLLRWLNPDISLATIAHIHFLVRKAAHATEYAILTALIFRASRSLTSHFWRRAAMALFPALLFAAADEFHQSFVASRTSSLGDVVIDSGGVLVGLILCLLLALLQRRSTG